MRYSFHHCERNPANAKLGSEDELAKFILAYSP